MCSCGSATVWTRWDRSGLPAAGTTRIVTTAAALTGGCSAPITAAKPRACGALGPAGRPAAFPAGRAGGPDTGEEAKVETHLFVLVFVTGKSTED